MQHAKRNHRIGAAIWTPALAALLSAVPAQAAVPTMDALTLYGNAVDGGLCKSISPSTQTLWVCELSQNPDIHITFNRGTDLHLTVRMTSAYGTQCDRNSYLDGGWPGHLIIRTGEPAAICNINVQSWVDRLNSATSKSGVVIPNCKNSFVQAQTDLRISATVANGYINRCEGR